MNDPAFEHRAPRGRALFRLDWDPLDIIHELTRETASLRAIEDTVLLADDGGLIGLAQPGSRFYEGSQHRGQIEPLKRLPQIIEQSAFSMAITA